MATSLRELRIKARKLGATNVREMDEDELQDYIDEHSARNGKSRKAKRGRPTKKATARKARKVVEEDEDEDEDEDYEEEAPRKRGRPKGSNKATAKRGPGRPKGSGRKATSTSTRKRGKVGRPAGSGTGTRVTLKSKINWNRNFDFRDGSTAQYILEQVRKSAKKYDDTDDIREDVIEKLEGKIGRVDELTFINRSTGRAHKGEAAEKMLRYRVSRTMLDYAIETGQHDGSGNGGSSKPATKRGPGRPKGSATKTKRGPGRPRKVVEDDYEDEEEEAPRRRGRPKGSKNKVKRGPGRPKGTTNKVKRGPGRPKGSKNKARR